MSGRLRLILITTTAVLVLVGLIASGSAGSAATFEGHWSMYQREDAASFAAGSAPFASETLPGYEIVGMDAKGVSESLAAYQYWGDAHVPPMQPIVTCSAAVVQPVLSLSIRGAYPYAGCVFFLGVTNAGDIDLRVELGAPGSTLPVACGGGPCQSSDVDVLAGGKTQSEVAERCSISGDGPGGVVAIGDSLTYRISPGYTFVCPLFVVVLQPACEDCEYSFELTPGPTEQALVLDTPTPTPTEPTDRPSPQPPTGTASAGPSPSLTVTTTPVTPSPTATLTPIDDVAGVRTPGAATPAPTSAPGASATQPTPLPPSSGTGVLVRRGSEKPTSIVPILLIASGIIVALYVAWPGKFGLPSADGAATPLWDEIRLLTRRAVSAATRRR